MKVDEFVKHIEHLTGSDVKDLSPADNQALRRILANDDTRIDCSQFNELLLLVNKDRVEHAFFEHFFPAECTISMIPQSVERFQKVAMRCYGNFVFAYRTLSRIADKSEFLAELGDAGRNPLDVQRELSIRPDRLLNIDNIAKEDTPLVGYLSVKVLAFDEERLDKIETSLRAGSLAEWDTLIQDPSVGDVAKHYRAAFKAGTTAEFCDFVRASGDKIRKFKSRVQTVRERARDNQNIYLTWDHMDVYFATSMRKQWEYEELHTFVSELMAHKKVRDLNLRYFDPTQSYADDRINKGLVEALMLKRAKCTVYSVQDTDTLGKDSELASTLAQGKTVIAYIPMIDIAERAEALKSSSPEQILQRFWLASYLDETIDVQPNVASAVKTLEDHVSAEIWPSIPDVKAGEDRKRGLSSALSDLCQVVATSEKKIYDRRAETLAKSHPLAVQVNLDTGVANGVLVVRNIEDCADLLQRVILCNMEFTIEQDDSGMWQLREKVSDCVYRVVTGDRKLSNCFWNFYLR